METAAPISVTSPTTAQRTDPTYKEWKLDVYPRVGDDNQVEHGSYLQGMETGFRLLR